MPAILAAALGGTVSSLPPQESLAPLSPPDSAAYWLFFTDSAWSVRESGSPAPEIPGRFRSRSRWLQAVSVLVDSEEVGELESLSGVSRVRKVRRLGRSPASPSTAWMGGDGRPSPARTLTGAAPSDTVYGALSEALETLGIPGTHDLGFEGSGTRVGILDGFFLSSHATVRSSPPVAVRDFVGRDISVDPEMGDPPEAASHGTALWSLVGGDLLGTLTGAAPAAAILLARVTSDSDTGVADEDRWVEGLEWLESQGARIVVSGVAFRNFEGGGYGPGDLNGDVAPATLAADEAARRGVLVVAPMGNEGPEPGSLGSPADGDSVLAVGAAVAGGFEAVFSGRGPATDGRSKPEILAPGVELPAASALSETDIASVTGSEYGAALVAGAAALFVEAYPERGSMEVAEALRRSVHAGGGAFDRIPNTAAAVLFPDGIQPLSLQEVDDQNQVTSLVPLFQWNVPTTHPLGLPVTYHLELAEDSLFQAVLAADSVLGTFARRLQAPLPPRARLFWRIRARSVQGVGWTSPPQGPVSVPSWVTLDVLSGPGGTQITDPQPEFRWTPLPLPAPAGPFTFHLQVLLDREDEVLVEYPGLEEARFTVDQPLPFNQPLRWRVIAQARSGLADTVTSAAPFVVTGGANPPVTILYQNFPNPFPNKEEGALETRIWFDLAAESIVELAIYDLRGRLVRTLIPGRGCGPVRLSPGLYGRDGSSSEPCVDLSWDGRDEGGGRVSAGVYLLRLRAGGVVDVRRVVFWP